MESITDRKQVKVKLLSPNVQFPDQQLTLDVGMTIAQLKDFIKTLKSEDLSDIRLLYGGKILNDDDILGDHLKTSSYMEDGDVFTIHLSCSVPCEHSEAQRMASAAPESRTIPELEAVHQDYQQGYGYPSWQTMYSLYNQPEFLYGTDDNQLAVIQELYTQYMAAYAEYIQLVHLPSSQAAEGASAPAPATGHTFTPAPAPAPAPEAAPRHQMMNAGGGGAGGLMEDEPRAGGDRDLLDWVYLSSRVMLLASVVYFYGSVVRLVLVSCVAILLYFYQTGYFGLGNHLRRLRDRERRLEERRERFRERVRDFRERIRVMQQNNPNQENPHEPPTEDEITNLINEQRADLMNAPVSPWVLVTNSIYMFFASLFPENIQEV